MAYQNMEKEKLDHICGIAKPTVKKKIASGEF